jgi:hypothetical protein
VETRVVPIDPALVASPQLARLIALRTMDADAFVERHASGTLRKNKRIGMVWREQYLHERAAYELGWAFECLPRSRVTFGDAYTEGDCKPLTEAGWHIERYIEMSVFPEDQFEAKYLNVEYKDGATREGVGIVVRQTSCAFVPGGHLAFAIIAEFDPRAKTWKDAVNPR